MIVDGWGRLYGLQNHQFENLALKIVFNNP